jgi:serine/threonine-protein kinase
VTAAGPPFDRARAFRLFDAALGLEVAARRPFLVAECLGDAALLAAVETLLADEAHGSQTVPAVAPLEPGPSRHLGRTFGHFRTVALIGQGGMGVVFRAERTDGVGQTVALKVLRGGGLTDTMGGRFTREMKTLARLEHPAVARLVDAGVAEDGTPWIAMELVPGSPIDAWCAARRTPLRERVRLLAELADAVAVAHRMLVVHCDLKPSNVLMTEEGAPKLIDFGIARLLEVGAGKAALTGGAPPFTPQYAPPEQVSGAPVSIATDVFGLGALAYRLLSGRTVFPSAESPLAYMLAVTQQEPPHASRAAREAGAEEDARQLAGDLDAVLAKALAREPAGRYPTAEAFRDDLRRVLEHRPVAARPPSLLRGAARFARRNRFATALAALLVAGAAAATASTVWQARRVAAERDAARAASQRAERSNRFITSMLQASDPAAGGRRDVTVAEVLDRAFEEARRLGGTEPAAAADALATIAKTDSSLGRFAEAVRAADLAIGFLRGRAGEERHLADALATRAVSLWSMSRWAEAEGAAREAVTLLEREPGTDAGRAAGLGRARTTLGVVLGSLGREKEAEATYRAAEADDLAGAVEDERLASLYNDWAVLVGSQGRGDEALELLGRASRAVARGVREEHPVAISVKLNLAGTLEVLGRREEAVGLYRQVIATRERVLGPLHADTLWAEISLGSLLADLGRHAEAATLAAAAAEATERTLGPAHQLTAFAWNVLGVARCGIGRHADGIASLRRAEAARVALVGAQHWRTANTRVRIGICLAMAGRPAEAEALLLPAVRTLEEVRGAGFDRTQDGYRALRDLYRGWGRPDEAARWGSKLTGP